MNRSADESYPAKESNPSESHSGGQEVHSETGRRRLIACEEVFTKTHKIRVAKLKIGNHAIAYLFAQRIGSLIQGPVEIASRGIAELGLAACHLEFYEQPYRYQDISCEYPWPSSHRPGRSLTKRAQEKWKRIVARLTRTKGSEDPEYVRFSIRTNTPNLYPIRSYSINHRLLIDVESSVSNIGYLPSLSEARQLLPGTSTLREQAKTIHQGFSDDPLIVHIRAGDILDGHHRLYKPLDWQLIKAASAELNRRPVFIGQLEESVLVRELKAAFPTADFLHTQSAGLDFEIMRQSRFLLLSTSTFAWLAGWLSTRAQCILIPQNGLYNPEEAPEINLVDCSDRRFHFLIA